MKTLLIFIVLLHSSYSDDSDEELTSDKDFIQHKWDETNDYFEGFKGLFDSFKKKKVKFGQKTFKNADTYRSTPELIESRGFRSQSHTVVTEDGYILGLFRIINPCIQHNSRLKPVLLWHGLTLNSNYWLLSSPGFLDTNGYYSERNGTLINNCKNRLTANLAFTLSACGYDVWLGNYRGNRYSSGHQRYNTNSYMYSNYTFTELGVYDIRNTIQYILNKTKCSHLGYIGSSIGTTPMFALLSLIPSFEKYVNPFIAIPPITFLGNTTSLFRFAALLVPLLNGLVLNVGTPLIVSEAIATICSEPLIQSICARVLLLTSENVPSYLSEPSAILANFGGGTGGSYVTSKLYLQFGQFIINGRFSQFDYMSSHLNTRVYGTPIAPDYPIGDITSRNIAFFRGPNDALLPPLDVYVVRDPTYNHSDYILATNNNRLINWRILALLMRRTY